MRNELKKLLLLFDQEHLLDDLGQVDDDAAGRCLFQINSWNPRDLAEQKKSWNQRRQNLNFEPVDECPSAEEQTGRSDPQNTAIIILAGGQGSRLGASGPKGCFPLLGKSLFERIIDKIRPQNPLLAILTSTMNHSETVSFFQNNDFFGLKDVLFFSQKTLPLFDETGSWFWEAPGCIAEGPDGNGSLFQSLDRAGILKRFSDGQIKTAHIVPVDNPLADPLDPVLSSFHQTTNADLTVKCIRLTDPGEPAGRLVRMNRKFHIAEFAELSLEERRRNMLANTGLLAIDIEFMNHLARQTFPLHWAFREANYLDRGRILKKGAWKAERFIVDALLFANESRILGYPRHSCFAPLKDKNSIVSIERLLQVHHNKSF